jgi:two-component system response regulator RegX3
VTETSAHILVVDDEPSITEFVSYNLKKEGYDVAVASTGDEALALAKREPFDLVVLDVMLPGIDGYEVCRRLRADSEVPVLFLSARDTELDKVVGLEIGGDDYLAKPFGVRELQARVKALLRRRHAGTRDGGTTSDRIEMAGIVVDEAAHTATADGRPIDLTPREFELLACLMRHSGKVLSRDQLLKEAWGWEYLVETKTVDTHVKRLRDKLETAGVDPSLVETVRGYGYRFKAVENADA